MSDVQEDKPEETQEDKQEETQEDVDWYAYKEQQLKEKYGGLPIKVVSTDVGEIDYICELCHAQCRTIQVLEIHLTSAKHIRKQVVWAAMKGIQTSVAVSELSVSKKKRRRPIVQPVALPEVPACQSATTDNVDLNEGSSTFNESVNDQPKNEEVKSLKSIEAFLNNVCHCELNNDEDAVLAINVVSLLLKPLKNYYLDVHQKDIVERLLEVEMHAETVKALHMVKDLARAK